MEKIRYLPKFKILDLPGGLVGEKTVEQVSHRYVFSPQFDPALKSDCLRLVDEHFA